MKRDFLKELGLEDDVINKVMTEHGKTINEYKEKTEKADELEGQISQYKQQLKERDTQLSELAKKAKGNEELTAKITELQEANDSQKEEYEKQLVEQKKQAKIELALKDAKAKNIKPAKAMLNLDAISLDGDNLIGLDEQLTALKNSDGYLFGSDEEPSLSGRDPVPGRTGEGNRIKNPFSKEHFNLTEQGKLYRENPELYKQLKAKA